MDQLAVALAVIIMTGVFLTVIAWQVLAIARTAVAKDAGIRAGSRKEASTLDERLTALEAVHDDTHADHHGQGSP